MSKRNWYTMALNRGSTTNATIDVFDDIGMFGISAASFRDDLKALGDVKHITLRLNSRGGEVYQAVAMFTMLDMHPAEITVQIVGLAASAASLLAMVGDTVQIAENAFMMIHAPATVAVGDDKELRKALAMLEKLRLQMARAYAKKSGLDLDVVEDMLAEETWFSAEEAVEQGFADEIIGEVQVAATFDPTMFGSVPAEAKHLFARRNTKKEAIMADKTKTPEETSEQMEARLREEIRAELVADASNKAAADKAAADKAAADKAAAAAATAPTADQVRAEIAQIVDACALAGAPDKASEYIAAKKSLGEVLADLKKVALANLGGDGEKKTTNHNNGGGSEDAKAVDVGAIYAKWNAPKASRARH